MNILVANISVLQKQKTEREYQVCVEDCEVQSVTASHTNECVFRTIVELKRVKDSGGIGKIIALVSKKTREDKNKDYNDKTAIEYYESIVRQFFPEQIVERVNLDDDNEQEREISEILNDVCNQIDQNDIVYLDCAGGKRTTSNLLQLLIKLLKYKGIENPHSLYADINGDNYKVTDTSSFQKMTNLADAFNEFMTSGRTKQLNECFSEPTIPEVKNLLEAMTEFSDKIQLGNIESLDDSVNKLKTAINELENTETSRDIKIVILKQLLPVIKEKLIGTNIDTIDYIKIIQWCLNNMLIQQALTIYVEKLPVYLFEHSFIKYNGAQNTNANVSSYTDWRTDYFYKEMLNIKEHLVEEMNAYFTEGKQPVHTECKRLVDELNKLKANWKNQGRGLSKDYFFFLSEINSRHIQSFAQFKNLLKMNKSLLSQALGIKMEKEENVFTRKFEVIQKIETECKINNNNFVLKKSNKDIAQIYYGYIYAKAMRNLTNHASSDENLSEKQKKILEKKGFDLSKNTVEVITRNLNKSLDFISYLAGSQ